MLIGITGQIGSGKSTAARILKSFGAVVVDADKIGRFVVDNDQAVLKKLIAAFGPEIVTSSGNLRRKKLASIVFGRDASRKKLNTIVHPPLLAELTRQVRQALKINPVVVIDAALFMEWKLDKKADLTIVIHTSRERRLKFLAQRGMSRRDAQARGKQQLSYAKSRKRADHIILNSGTEKQLRTKLRKLWDNKIST